ncbi:hypothetical protein LCGC14_2738800, partial [marine sediment metagenome]
GIERIRTAVQAFAELRLATRPRCHFRSAKIVFLEETRFKYRYFFKIYGCDLVI